MAKSSLHQQVVIKSEKDLLRLKEILSKKNPIPDNIGDTVQFMSKSETNELLTKWGIRG
jgi:hypothetical protein